MKHPTLKTHIPLYNKVLLIATELRVQPIVYGGVAVWYFTGGGEDDSIHDIDILFPSELFENFSDIWNQDFPAIPLEKNQWGDIVIKDGHARIDIDSKEKYLGSRDDSAIEYTFDTISFPILNQESLKELYKISYECMPENEFFHDARRKYKEKYSQLSL